MSGDTKRPLDPTKNTDGDTPVSTEQKGDENILKGMSDVVHRKAMETASETEEPTDEELKQIETEDVLDKDTEPLVTHGAKPPSVVGEQSESGHMASPQTDDDTLKNAQKAGFQQEETSEKPQPVDMARDVDKAEQSIKDH